jgi:nitronate monooxygenase
MVDLKNRAVPIIQAPMAGGVCPPALVAAVCEAGGVGSFGFAYSTPEKIDQDLTAVKALTKGCVNANFFLFRPVQMPPTELQDAAMQALMTLPVIGAEALPAPLMPVPPFYPDLNAQLEPIWEHRPGLLTFHFGIPPAEVIDQARRLGISVGVTATSETEALAIEQAGADFIVAQGIEAGGHRGFFDPEAADEGLITLELTRRLAKLSALPIVSAGGIMDGADIAAALRAGAVAAQMGTAFLCCDESGASQAHQRFVLTQGSRGSAVTRAFSGRPARGVNNAFIELMKDKSVLPFPLQNSLTGPLRQLAVKADNGEFQSLWAGSQYSRARQMPAAVLVRTLLQEMQMALS